MFYSCRNFICGVLIILTCWGVSPARADDTFLNDWFPSIFGERDKTPKPQETLIAPFAQNKQQSRVLSGAERKALTSPENSVPITEPHRSDKYILNWASERAAGVFIYNTDQIKQRLTKNGTDLKKIPTAQLGEFLLDQHFNILPPYFMPEAVKSVQAYMDQSGMLTAMRGQQQIQAFTKTTPQMMNEGVFSNAYRWLIDIPVTYSIMPPGMDNYMGKNRPTPTTQNIVIRVQIVRTQAADAYVDGMAIETFTILGAS